MSRDCFAMKGEKEGEYKFTTWKICVIVLVKFSFPCSFLRSVKKRFLGNRQCPFYNRATAHNSWKEFVPITESIGIIWLFAVFNKQVWRFFYRAGFHPQWSISKALGRTPFQRFKTLVSNETVSLKKRLDKTENETLLQWNISDNFFFKIERMFLRNCLYFRWGIYCQKPPRERMETVSVV